jgi:hypothetical protein
MTNNYGTACDDSDDADGDLETVVEGGSTERRTCPSVLDHETRAGTLIEQATDNRGGRSEYPLGHLLTPAGRQAKQRIAKGSPHLNEGQTPRVPTEIVSNSSTPLTSVPLAYRAQSFS